MWVWWRVSHWCGCVFVGCVFCGIVVICVLCGTGPALHRCTDGCGGEGACGCVFGQCKKKECPCPSHLLDVLTLQEIRTLAAAPGIKVQGRSRNEFYQSLLQHPNLDAVVQLCMLYMFPVLREQKFDGERIRWTPALRQAFECELLRCLAALWAQSPQRQSPGTALVSTRGSHLPSRIG